MAVDPQVNPNIPLPSLWVLYWKQPEKPGWGLPCKEVAQAALKMSFLTFDSEKLQPKDFFLRLDFGALCHTSIWSILSVCSAKNGMFGGSFSKKGTPLCFAAKLQLEVAHQRQTSSSLRTILEQLAEDVQGQEDLQAVGSSGTWCFLSKVFNSRSNTHSILFLHFIMLLLRLCHRWYSCVMVQPASSQRHGRQ